jgi:hypothetical protein
VLEVDERAEESDDQQRERESEAPQDDERVSTTPATNASRSASVPSLT